VKHVKGVGQAQSEYLEQIELKLVATVGQGERLAEARVDDGHEGNLTYAVNLLDKKINWGQININFQSKGIKAKGGRQ
jgi:hypothetical protein